mgnify:CR=1 FL=1
MATRRRSSASKSATATIKKSPKRTAKVISEIQEVLDAPTPKSLDKVTPTRAKRVNKTTRSAKVVTETVTEAPKVETKNVKSLLKDYPRDGFSLILLPLLLLEAGTKEGLRLAGVLS